MAFLLFGNAVILAVLAAGYSRRLSPYSPLMLSALVWQVVFVSGLVFGHKFFPLTDRAFVMWLVWFLVSAFFYQILSSQPQPAPKTEVRRLPVDYTVILVGLILWLVWQVRVVGSTGPAAFFSNLRLSSNEIAGLESLGPVGRFYPLVFALFLFEHVNARAGNVRLRLLLWCLMLLYAVATMGKLAILTPVLSWAVIRGLRFSMPTRRLFILAPVAFGVMMVLHFVRAVRGDQFVLTEFLSVYSYSPIVALGYMQIPTDAAFGAQTFRFVYAVLDAVVGGMAPVNVVQGYVAVPYVTNVYTAIQHFALDFGLAGVFFGATAYGIFFGGLYHQARSLRQGPLILYAGFSVILVSQFIGEFLFTMFSGQLQLFMATVVLTSLSQRVEAA